jgi:hypothetical protein
MARRRVLNKEFKPINECEFDDGSRSPPKTGAEQSCGHFVVLGKCDTCPLRGHWTCAIELAINRLDRVDPEVEGRISDTNVEEIE